MEAHFGLWMFLAFLYFVPTFIGTARKVAHSNEIFLLNALLGWTLLGWMAALIWSIVGKTAAASTP